MEIVNIEARTFEAMLSAFRTFADRLDTLAGCTVTWRRRNGWTTRSVPAAEGQPENPADPCVTYSSTLAYTQICHKTYYKPGDVKASSG